MQAWCGSLSGNELTRNLSGNTRPQSSQLAEPLWTDPGLKSGISVQKLICTSKAENEWSNILPKILASEEKAIIITGNEVMFHSKCRAFPSTGRVPWSLEITESHSYMLDILTHCQAQNVILAETISRLPSEGDSLFVAYVIL